MPFINHGFILYDQTQDKREVVEQERLGEYPFNCIGLIAYRYQGGQCRYATGFLIDAEYVITIAAAVRDRSSNTPSQAIAFWISQHDEMQEINVAQSCFPEQFQQIQGNRYDYAMLKLSSPLQREKYIKLSIGGNLPENFQVSIFGYPHDKLVFDQQKLISAGLLGESGPIKKVSNGFLYHSISTSSGQAGSPILIKYEDSYIALGIHRAYSMTQKINMGIAVTQELLSNLGNWKMEMFTSSIKFYRFEGKELIPMTAKELQAMPPSNEEYIEE